MNDHIIKEDQDLVLPPEIRSAWITVDGFSVYISRCDEGVGVSIYALDDEFGDALGETFAFYNELPENKPNADSL